MPTTDPADIIVIEARITELEAEKAGCEHAIANMQIRRQELIDEIKKYKKIVGK